MPLKLCPPISGRTPNWRVRGTYLHVYVDRSAQTGDRRVAAKLLAEIKEQIERGRFAQSSGDEPGFAAAALSYMRGGGERRFVAPLLKHFGETPLSTIDQDAVDAAAAAILPDGAMPTLNRQVYTPMSAILKHAGFDKRLRRPKGWRGTPRLHWLAPEQAIAFLDAASAIDARFGALLTFLLYCGLRLSEALRLEWTDVDLAQSFAYVRRTKNGHPQPVHLPAIVIAELAELPRDRLPRATKSNPVPKPVALARVFDGLTKSGRLYALHAQAEKASGVAIPDGITFHIWRHTYGAWMRRYGGLDTSGLVATGRWLSRQSAQVYEHVESSEEARRADLLPTRVKSVRKLKK